MPPSKASRTTTTDDAALDQIAATKARIAAQALSSGRGKRNGVLHTVNASILKEVAAASDAASQVNGNGSATGGAQNGISWGEEDSELLQRYRQAHRLPLPSSFTNPMAQCMLAHGIGKSSPTMARAKGKRRISKEQLALAVRKNFNAQPVNESEAIVELLYRIRMKDKAFRIKFPAVKNKQ